MRSFGVLLVAAVLSPVAVAQTTGSTNAALPSPQPPAPAPQPQQMVSYANYSIMLVNPAGGAVVLMHSPTNSLELVDVNKTKEAFVSGYLPVRAAELGELIGALKEENAQLAIQNRQLRIEVANAAAAPSTTPAPSRADIEAQKSAALETQKAAHRQQLIQAWMMLQNMNRPKAQNLHVTVTDCTQSPALCAGK